MNGKKSDRILGYLMILVGLLFYFSLIGSILGYNIVGFQGLIEYADLFTLTVLSIVVISLSTAFLSYEDHRKISSLGGFLFIVSALLYLVNYISGWNKQFQVLIDSLLLMGIVFIAVSAGIRGLWFKAFYGPKHIGATENLVYKMGTAFKAFSSALAIYWVIYKLLNSDLVSIVFGGGDYILITAFVGYIIGSALESYGGTSPISGAFSGIRSGLTSAFGTSLMLVILSYILMLLGLVSEQWYFLHEKLIYTTLVLFAGTVIAYLMLPGGEVDHFIKTLDRSKKINNIFVARRNGELDFSDDFSVLVESGALVSKLEFDNDEKYKGAYILGYGVYNIKTPFGKLSGSFDKLWIISKEDYWTEIDDSLELSTAGYINLEDFGFLNREAFFDFLKNEEERIIRLISKVKKGATYIKFPFLEIYDGGDKEYVKIGPLTIAETDKSTYISIGPFKIVDENVKALKKFSSKKDAKIVVGLNDKDKGELIIKVFDTHVELVSDKEKIDANQSEIKITGENSVATYSGDEIKVVKGNLTLKAKKGEYAKLVSGSNIVSANLEGDIKIIRGGKVIKIKDKELAHKVIDKIYNTGIKLLEKRFEVEQRDEVSDLLEYLDKLIKD